jgi:nitroreductase
MFVEQIRKRRSLRKYQNKSIEPEKLDTIIEAILRSPSSRGLNPWQFVVVTERELLEKLSQSKPHGSSFVKGAAAAIVICADVDTADTWIEDGTIATLYAQLAAESMGLGSCWVQIRDRPHNDQQSSKEYIAQLLGIPSNLEILSLAVMGYPDEEKSPHKKEDLQYKKVRLNNYETLYSEST